MSNFKNKKDDLALPVDMRGIFGGDYTLQEIADVIGITRERVRQIEASAIKKLRHPKFRKQWKAIIETVQMMEEERARNTNLG